MLVLKFIAGQVANSVDPDQICGIWFRSTRFAQACLIQYLGLLL